MNAGETTPALARPQILTTAADRKETQDLAAAQWRESMQGDIPKVTCACGLCAPIRFLHRCLYCGCFFCVACAEVHFGETRAEYQARVKVVDA